MKSDLLFSSLFDSRQGSSEGPCLVQVPETFLFLPPHPGAEFIQPQTQTQKPSWFMLSSFLLYNRCLGCPPGKPRNGEPQDRMGSGPALSAWVLSPGSSYGCSHVAGQSPDSTHHSTPPRLTSSPTHPLNSPTHPLTGSPTHPRLTGSHSCVSVAHVLCA